MKWTLLSDMQFIYDAAASLFYGFTTLMMAVWFHLIRPASSLMCLFLLFFNLIL